MKPAHQSRDSHPAAAMTPVKAFLTLLGVVMVLALFIFLSHFLGIKETWGAFLFLLYWGGIQHADGEKMPATVMGAVFGLLLTYLMHEAPIWFGATGPMVFLGVLLIVVFFQLMGWFSIAVNMSAMLFLTVGTIPAIQLDFDFVNTLIGLAGGIAYFVGLRCIAAVFLKPRTATARS